MCCQDQPIKAYQMLFIMSAFTILKMVHIKAQIQLPEICEIDFIKSHLMKRGLFSNDELLTGSKINASNYSSDMLLKHAEIC